MKKKKINYKIDSLALTSLQQMRKPNSIKAAFIRFIPWWIIKTFKSFLETYFSHHCSSPHICIHLWNHRFEPSYLAARAKERQRSFTPQCQRYHLMKSTFILEHLVCLVRTASAGRCRAVRAKPQVGTWEKKKRRSLLTARWMKNSEISLLIQLSARQRHV